VIAQAQSRLCDLHICEEIVELGGASISVRECAAYVMHCCRDSCMVLVIKISSLSIAGSHTRW
jgi:hypothetical protein